jgi:hypothetical protein
MKLRDWWIELVAFGAALGYCAYTGHIWEDYLIAFRHSQNFVNGHGLTYNPGEPVYGFTSPLGVLLPAFFYWLTGAGSFEPALWLFRLVTMAAFAATAGLGFRLVREHSGNPVAALVFLSFFLLDVKAVAYSTNGMETALMLFFVLLSLKFTLAEDDRGWWALGLSWAGLMWTRPDSVVYVAVMSLATFLLWPRPARRSLKRFLKAGLITTAAYLPWIVFTAWYYGSPIPQTVKAKGALGAIHLLPNASLSNPLKYLSTLPLLWQTALTFGPPYMGFGGWPWWLMYALEAFSAVGLLYWLIPSADRFGRFTSFCFFGVGLYLCTVIAFPWYLPVTGLFGWLTLASVLGRGLAHSRAGIVRVSRLGWGGAAGGLIILWLASAHALRIQQREVENGNRRQIGEWLREHRKADDAVASESIGYVGFFSGARIIDFPGLVSPSVLPITQKTPGDYNGVIQQLRPAWVVLRHDEILGMNADTHRDYELAKTFDVRPRLAAYGEYLGNGYAKYDAHYFILHRRISGLH